MKLITKLDLFIILVLGLLNIFMLLMKRFKTMKWNKTTEFNMM